MILATRQGDRQQRSVTISSELMAAIRGGGYGSTAGMAINNRTAAGIPAFHAAVTFAGQAVASLTMRVWRGEGPIKERVNGTWQARLFRGSPNPEQSQFTFWETIEASLTARNNAYIWKTKGADGKVEMLWALHPDQVYTPLSTQEYYVTFWPRYPTPYEVEGYGAVKADKSILLHIRGRGGLGEIIAPSPIKVFASALGISLAKQEHEASLYARGASGGLAVIFPKDIKKDQAKEWQEVFDSNQAGPSNTGKTKVVGGGASLQVIGMTQADAQFAESVGLSVLDVSRITNVPAWFLGISDKTSKPMTPEHEQRRWMSHGFGPRLARIESALNADTDLFGMAADYAAFDTAGLIRGDLATEADITIRKVQAGIWLPDEARAMDSLQPYPDGVGQIPQVTPVGGTPNANPIANTNIDGTEEE